MKINVAQEIKDMDGKGFPTKNADGVDENLQLRDVIIRGLGQPEQQIEPGEAIIRYRLAFKIKDADEVDLKSEEITKIKGLICKVGYTPIITGQAIDMMDPPAEEKKE